MIPAGWPTTRRARCAPSREELELTLRGKGAAAPFLIMVLPHHLYLLGELMEELEFVERKMARVDNVDRDSVPT